MRWRAAAAGVCCMVAASAATAQQAAPPPPATRSVVFDKEADALARMRQSPEYVERIFVEGRDPDAPRTPRKSLERRFADTLVAAQPAAAAGMRPLDATPCMSMPSTWNVIGTSFAPLTGCPR